MYKKKFRYYPVSSPGRTRPDESQPPDGKRRGGGGWSAINTIKIIYYDDAVTFGANRIG